METKTIRRVRARRKRRRARRNAREKRASSVPSQHTCSTITIGDQFSEKNTHVRLSLFTFSELPLPQLSRLIGEEWNKLTPE